MENVKLAKVKTKEVGQYVVIEILLPNGDHYRLSCTDKWIDVNSTNNFESKDLVIRPRVSNEVRIMAVSSEHLD